MSDLQLIKQIPFKPLICNLVGYDNSDFSNSSEGFRCPCPICKDSNKHNFTVDESKNVFKCHKCNKSGSTIDFVKEVKNIETNEAIQFLDKEILGNSFHPAK